MFEETLNMIEGLDIKIIGAVKKRLDSLSKPLGSLGKLEDIVQQIAGITGQVFPNIGKKAIVIMCSDNGVVDEGITQAPKNVTSAVTKNFFKGITGINVFARHTGADIFVVDIGIDDDIECPGIICKKIRKGTRNMALGPAMTRDETIKAIEAGISVVSDLRDNGYNLLGTGEMGIGNTTTSSAIVAVLTGAKIEEVVGRGAGLTSEGLKKKIDVVKHSIKINNPDHKDPLDVLSKLGGYDIAGLVGCYIGAAANRVPILIDGFISSTAALLATRIKPEVKSFMLPSHMSSEPGSRKVIDALGLEPYLKLDMRLGEGTGAALAFHVIDAAMTAYKEMGTFDDARIDKYVPLK
jgi:nicotinate-nucleotide--dimethylbenzimidazole phosphoribosyltransferase